jgi:hypothetical protein
MRKQVLEIEHTSELLQVYERQHAIGNICWDSCIVCNYLYFRSGSRLKSEPFRSGCYNTRTAVTFQEQIYAYERSLNYIPVREHAPQAPLFNHKRILYTNQVVTIAVMEECVRIYGSL